MTRYVLERHDFPTSSCVRKVLTRRQVQTVRGQEGQVAVGARTTRLVTREGTIDVELDNWVEFSRFLQNLETIPTFILLRHKIHVLVVTNDFVCRLVLLSFTSSCYM